MRSAWLMFIVPSLTFFTAQVLFVRDASWPVVLDYIYVVLAIATAIYGFRSVLIYRSLMGRGRVVLCLSLGIAGLALGELIWLLLDTVYGIEPYPSLADGFYLMGYLGLIMGMKSEMVLANFRFNRIKWDMREYGLVAVGLILAVIVGYFGVYKSYDPEGQLLENLFVILYALADLVLILMNLVAFSFIKEYEGGLISKAFKWFVLAFLLTLIADVVYAVNRQLYDDGVKIYRLLDSLWIASYMAYLPGFTILNSVVKIAQKRIKI